MVNVLSLFMKEESTITKLANVKMSHLSKMTDNLNKTNLEVKKTQINDKIEVSTRTSRLNKTNVELK